MTEDQLQETHELLAELNKVKVLTRATLLTSNWRMFIVWGLVLVGSVFPGAVDRWDLVSWYWLVAPLVSLLFIEKCDWTAVRPARDYWAIGAGIFVGAWVAAFFLSGSASILGTWLAMVIGFIGFALLDRQKLIALGLGALLIWGATLFLLVDDEATIYFTLMAGLGGFLLALGIGLRSVRPSA